MAFLDGPAPPRGPNFEAELRKRAPRIFFTAYHSKNDNVVIFEAQTDAYGNVDFQEPVAQYWLVLDPEQQRERRRRGCHHDRCNLTWYERKIFFPLTTERKGDALILGTPHDRSIRLRLHLVENRGAELTWYEPFSEQLYRVHSIYTHYRWGEHIKFTKGKENLHFAYFLVDNLSRQDGEVREKVVIYGNVD